MRWINILFVLAVNAVPFYGAMFLGWSVSTILVLYWVQNLLIIVTTSTRIVLHRIWTRKRGHWTGSPPGTGPGAGTHANTFFAQYAAIALIFTLAHGIFVLALAFGMNRSHPGQSLWQFSFVQFRQGALSMCVILVFDLLADLTTLRQRSFAWLKIYVDRRMVRVFILHIAIIFGMLAILLTNSPLGLLSVLILLKTAFDLATAWFDEPAPVSDTAPDPPAWMLRAARKIAGGGKAGGDGEDFLSKWRSDYARQQAEIRRCEEIMPAA